MRPTCFFRDFDSRCSGRTDRVHLIPAQRLRHLHLEDWDRRVWVWGCRGHHHRFDAHFISLTRDQIPPEVERYAEENGVLWSLDRDYGLREAA